MFFSDKVGPTGRVYAFEPQPFIHSVLNFNLVLNDASKNVQTFRGVLGHAVAAVHVQPPVRRAVGLQVLEPTMGVEKCCVVLHVMGRALRQTGAAEVAAARRPASSLVRHLS